MVEEVMGNFSFQPDVKGSPDNKAVYAMMDDINELKELKSKISADTLMSMKSTIDTIIQNTQDVFNNYKKIIVNY